MALKGTACAIRLARDRERPEQQQSGRRNAAPMAFEPVFRDAHDSADEAEAEHRETDDERAEMRPAADRKDPHDADLQGDHRTGDETDGAIEQKGRPPRRSNRVHLLCVPAIASPSSFVNGTKGTTLPL